MTTRDRRSFRRLVESVLPALLRSILLLSAGLSCAAGAVTPPAEAPMSEPGVVPASNPPADPSNTPPAPGSPRPAPPDPPPAADHREHVAVVADRVDVHAMMEPADFWPRLTPYSHPGAHAADDLWSVPLLRFYFFGGGGLFPNLGHPALAMEHETLWPAKRGYLGKDADPQHYFVIATDVHLDPVLMPHDGLSSKYYPRREGDWLLSFYLPSSLFGADSTGELFPDTVESFSQRSEQLADFILYSQYDANGDNQFSHDNYLADYAPIVQQAQQQRWSYGFDDLFDVPWTDISGYTWSAHEPDLGVNAGSEALALIRTWEVTRKSRYLDAAREFLLHQIPRHGFHSGLWKGRRYYWLSATPDLDSLHTEDPVNSVEAQVAAPLAAVGYYTRDDAMIELARGLLWYLCREWSTNGRWYYEGQENTAIVRDHPLLSQEGVCGSYAAQAVPYLLKDGIDLAPETEILTQALHFLVTHRPDSYPVEPSAFRYARSWLTFGQTRGLRPGNSILLRTYLQVTGAGAQSMTLQEKLPEVVDRPESLELTVKHGADSTVVKAKVGADGSFSVPVGAAPFHAWDLFTVDVTVTLNSKFTVDELPIDPPVVEVTTPEGGAPVSATGEAQDYHYQTRMNAQNFLDIPRWFYFPHNPGVGE